MKHWKLFTIAAVLALYGLAACNNGSSPAPEITPETAATPAAFPPGGTFTAASRADRLIFR